METIWCKPFDYYREKDGSIVQYEVTDWSKEIGRHFLLAVDEAGSIVIGLKLKTWKNKTQK